ncbi:cupin domain-containing protein [Cellulomonas carbonis]|uniref:Cupin type-2 domain-containing protein n=1 Tax=Cellulomonas carbonis T26 TaxID=947969 RepID=A0A0A0BTD6_9CELL|nr:cupin domain-containing protein [Cellulomonas carbonis]KGM11673.1 hypothetical protein N868_07865 [Cellulomonas carbonis T26]GGB99086.1 hypothetical protein GCM10010972_09890 [Cellulomonas carbonis]
MTTTWVRPEEGLHHAMIDGDHVAKATVEGPDGAFEVFEVHAAATPPAPMHVSPWSGVLYVLDGTVTVSADGRVDELGPGAMVVLPAGTPCTFHVADGEARFLAVTSGTGAGRFFAEMAATVPVGPPDPGALSAIASVAARHGVAVQV